MEKQTMKKYKCIKQPPNTTFEVGQITDNELCEQLPEYFVKYLFTTHDGVDVYTGDKYYWFNKTNTMLGIMETTTCNNCILLYTSVRFSSESAAQSFLDELNKPKFGVVSGKIYRDKDLSNEWMMCVTHIENGKAFGYGFYKPGAWTEWIKDKGTGGANTHQMLLDCIEATSEEWESALIKEAERRGYTKPNAEWISLLTNQNVNREGQYNNTRGFEYSSYSEALYFGYGCVYQKGKWAEIIQEPKEKTNRDYYDQWWNDARMYSFLEWLDKNNLIITTKK